MEAIAPTIASSGKRVVAFLIDAMVMLAISGIVNPIGFTLAGAYLLTRDALPFLDGQSIGKQVLNLQAVDYKGDPLTNNWVTGIMRNIFLLIPIMPFIELIILMLNEDGLRLGDQIANTRVVDADTEQTAV